jgi:hypothetical protein
MLSRTRKNQTNHLVMEPQYHNSTKSPICHVGFATDDECDALFLASANEPLHTLILGAAFAPAGRLVAVLGTVVRTCSRLDENVRHMSELGNVSLRRRIAAQQLAEDVVAGAEKVLTKNGAAFVAIVDAKKLDYYHELERRERGRMLMLSDAERGLQDVLAGRVLSAEDFRKSLQDRAEKRRLKNQA